MNQLIGLLNELLRLSAMVPWPLVLASLTVIIFFKQRGRSMPAWLTLIAAVMVFASWFGLL